MGQLTDGAQRGSQIHLQRVLGLPTPRYLHTPLLLGADGEKLSKQNGAMPVDTSDPVAALREAGTALGLRVDGRDVTTWLAAATARWRACWFD